MDGQGGYYDGREKREESYSYQQQPQQQLQQQQQQPQQQQQHQQHQPSPPHSASPFAFAPPPLSSQQQRPAPLTHQQHSEPLPSVQYQTSYYTPRPAQPVHASSFPASAPMGGYRSYSNESAPARNSPPPQNAPMSRTTSMTFQPQAQPQPPQPQHSHSYNSAYRSPPAAYASASTRPSPYGHPSYYPQQQYQPVGTPGSVEMPRSVSYPNYSQGYPASYMPGQPYASHHPSLPPLLRHTSTSTIGEGVSSIDINNRSSVGYTFGHRLPLVDRPFKCDECVQSFNRNHDLKRHKRIHLAVKPFGCNKCGKTFSRKDALRRHWLVKGCRGEDGATAPIMPLFPINAQPPALSPPSPPGNSSPTEQTPFTTGPLSFSHPSAPPPLSTLPPRQHNESTTSLLVTPHEIPASAPAIISLDEAQPITQRTSQSSTESYFEAAQNQNMGPRASMMEKSQSSGSHASPYSRYPASANQYRQSPGSIESGTYQRVLSSTMSVDGGKPVFAAPFNGQYESGGMLAPGASIGMEKQLSQMSAASADGETPAWQPRWHRPSFPFPPPAGSNYNYEPPSPADMPQAQQAYA